MTSAVPSPALLNVRLTSEKLALEERLRGVSKEIREVTKRNRALEQQNASLADRVAELEEIQCDLRAHLARLLGAGAKWPIIAPGQGVLFADANADDITAAIEDLASFSAEESEVVELAGDDVLVPDAEEAQEPARTKPRRDRKQRKLDESNLRREVRRSELAPEERRCPETGVELVETGVKVTTELGYRSAELYLIEHHQVVYGPAPEVAEVRTIEPLLAPPHEPAVEGVTAAPSLLAWLLCQKYVLHLPLYRQEDAFARLGVQLSRKTLCDWVLKTAFALAIVAREIERQIRAGPVLQLDDTPIKVRRPGPGGGKEKYRQSYLWTLTNPEVSGVAFRFTEGRATEDVAAVLGTAGDAGDLEVLVGDGYRANVSGARAAGIDVVHAGCWAHMLRKFRDALQESPRAMALFMKDVAELYAIERQARDEGMDADARRALRQRESLPIAVRLMQLTSGWQAHYSLKGKVADAMKYARGQRRALLAFLRDGRIPIDNNACERSIRPVAIGRGNWMFAGSVEGAIAAATIYTLVESAKATGVDPLAYLEAVLERLGTCPASEVDRLTPWAMATELPRALDRRATA
jgi:transposase